MSELQPHSPQQQQQSPNSSNPNPNCDFAEEINPEIQNPPPKSPLSETLKHPDQETLPEEKRSNLLVDVDDEQEQEDEDDNEDDEGMINMSLSSPLPPPQGLISKTSKVLVSSVRRNKKRKKGAGKKNITIFKYKLGVLSEGFKPIPFVPSKGFDFSRFEENLRKLGLWDFVHLEFDANVRTDILVEFIAGYTPKTRVSYVDGFRVKVSRADLARALRLPVKKPTADSEGESFLGEILPFLEEFVLSWMVLQESDVWVTPNEIVNWMKMIKEGQLHRVDWAGIVWFMMEKELSQGPGLKDCYYASHMQRLIRDQRENLFTETVDLDAVDEQKVEESVDVDAEKLKVEEVTVEDEDDGDVKMVDAHESSLGEESVREECVVVKLEQECAVAVETVGASDVVEKEKCSDMAEKEKVSDLLQKDGDVDMVERTEDAESAEAGDDDASKLKEADNDVDEEKNEDNVASMEAFDVAKEEENVENVECADNAEDSKGISVDDMVDFGFEKHWPLHGMDNEPQHVLQPCSTTGGLKLSVVEDSMSDGDGDGAGDDDVEDEAGEDDSKPGYNFMEESTPTMEGMTARNLMDAIETGHLSFSNADLGGQSSLGLMPQSRAENNVMLNGSSMFNDTGKRQIDDHEHDYSHKRMRMDDNHWDDKPDDAMACIDELLHWAQKTKMSYEAEKYDQANMMQMYNSQIEAKESEIMQWKFKYDDLQRTSHAEIQRRDRELHLMNNVIDGYRKALKDTHRAFSEYRKLCQIPDEPIYKDAGSGGVVKSVMELEKERIKQEEERKRMCYLFEDAYNKHVFQFELLCRDLHVRVTSLDDRLSDAAQEVALLKDDFGKRKKSGNAAMSEEVQSKAEEPQKDDCVKDKATENVEAMQEGQGEAEELPKDDVVEPETSENIEMSKDIESEEEDDEEEEEEEKEEGQNEAQDV